MMAHPWITGLVIGGAILLVIWAVAVFPPMWIAKKHADVERRQDNERLRKMTE